MTQNEAYGELAHAIVEQAVKDWRMLCQKMLSPKGYMDRITQDITFDSLRKFFKSEWCETLCWNVSAKGILYWLEKELAETLEKLQAQEVAND